MNVKADYFRPSAISGLIRLRQELSSAVGKSADEICRQLAVTYANAGLDMVSATALHDVMPPLPGDTAAAFRCILSELIVTTNPHWIGHLKSGRENFLSAVSADVRLCFERAGALDPIPDLEVVKWLDTLISLAYAQHDARLLASGREAESLSYAYEFARLAPYPTAPKVKWVALDANHAGFDVLSATPDEGCFRPRYIEVKASRRKPLQIFITRHEWETACKFGDAYLFHVWHLPSECLTEVSFREMQANIPIDLGRGEWSSVQVEIGDNQ